MLRTSNVSEALECLYLGKKAIVLVSDVQDKYDTEMYILIKLLHHQGHRLSKEDLEKGNYTEEQAQRITAASRKIKYFLKFVIQ